MSETFSVLICEDEEQVRNLLKTSLLTQNYEVRTAKDGQEAVELYAQAPASAVLMDLNMPRKDGCQAIREIRAMKDGDLASIVVLTALDTPQWEKMAKDAGATLFMTKPFSPKDVLHCLRTILVPGQGLSAAAAVLPKKTAPKNPAKEIHLKVRYATPEGFIQCYLKNLLDRRSFIATKNPLPLGSRFNIEITPPPPLDQKPFSVSGEVRWINLYEDQRGMGVQFSFENSDDEKMIHDWVMNFEN